MAKTIRDTILAYPGLTDCEDFWITSFCRDAVLKVQKIVRRSISKNKSWWPPTFIPWSAVCRTSRKTSSLSRIPVHGMTLRRNDYTGREENRRKRN